MSLIKIKKSAPAQDAASGAMDGAGYVNYVMARIVFMRLISTANSAAMELLSAVSGFEKDPQYNKEFAKMVKTDTDFVKKFIELKKQLKI